MYLERDRKIDILRFISISLIILAHSGNVPPILFQLRNFDVILMVLLLGMSLFVSSKNRKIDYKYYLFKRFNHLIIPAWSFLIFFFTLFWIISIIADDSFYFNTREIVLSFAFTNGIGFVWIIKVFFAVSIFSPLLVFYNRRIKSNIKYFLSLFLLYLFYSILVIIHYQFSNNIRIIFEHIVLHSIGYGIIVAVGIRLKKLSFKELLFGCFSSLIIFIILLFVNDSSGIQAFKYPPTLYYFSYGIFISLMLYLLLDIPFICRLFTNKFVFFISENSLWIYFWHIIPFYIIELFGKRLPLINSNFSSRFLFIYFPEQFILFVETCANCLTAA